MSNLYTSHMQFTITLEDKFQYQWALIQYIQNKKVENMQKKSYTMNLRDILDQEKQKIGVNKKLHPTGTLAMNFLIHYVEANLYVQLPIIPQKYFNRAQVKVSVSINADPVDLNKWVNNKWRKDRN